MAAIGSAAGTASQSELSLRPIVYEASYAGSYYFDDYNRGYGSSPGSLLRTSETFTWSRVVTETFQPKLDGSLTESG